MFICFNNSAVITSLVRNVCSLKLSGFTEMKNPNAVEMQQEFYSVINRTAEFQIHNSRTQQKRSESKQIHSRRTVVRNRRWSLKMIIQADSKRSTNLDNNPEQKSKSPDEQTTGQGALTVQTAVAITGQKKEKLKKIQNYN